MKPLQPSHFHYQGFFRLRAPSGRPAWERFGHGGHAMTYNAANDSLFIAGHEHYDLVAEIDAPGIFQPVANGMPTPGDGGRAAFLREFFDPAPWRSTEERKLLDTLSGLAVRDGVLYSLWHTYYGVGDLGTLDVGTLAARPLDDSFMALAEFSHIGPSKHPFNQKNTSGYLFEAPKDWCEANGIPTQTMLCGRGDGAGNATSPKGPALFAFDPINPEEATTLLYRAKGQEPPGWTPCDKWTGGTWIRAGGYEAVVFIGEVAADPWWYGKPDMPDELPAWFHYTPIGTDWREHWKAERIRDRWRPGAGSKGYHTTRREVRLQGYMPHFLSGVVTGAAGPTVEPSWTHNLDAFHEAANPRACAWDPDGRRFFVFEHYPPTDGEDGYTGEQPRIHVWRVEVPNEPEPEPEPEREVLTVTIVDPRTGERWAGDIEREDE